MNIKENVLNAFEIIKDSYKNGGTVYCAGNGGSASDSEYIVGELLKSLYLKKRRIRCKNYTCLFIIVFAQCLKKNFFSM